MNDPIHRPLHGHTPHNITWLLIGTCGLSGLGWLINANDPDSSRIIGVFFVLLFITAYAISFFATNIVRRSFLLGSGVFGFFVLRYLGLRDWHYILLLAACLFSLELYFKKK